MWRIIEETLTGEKAYGVAFFKIAEIPAPPFIELLSSRYMVAGIPANNTRAFDKAIK
jgi:hypothetical protein